MQRKQLLKNLPSLMQNKFFSLKFVGTDHHLCLVRKSNIAYTFTNFGTPVLNSQSLEKEFRDYKGKYRLLSFFQTSPLPSDTAAERIKYRRRVKTGLFEALHKNLPNVKIGDMKKVSGIYIFRFITCPATAEDFCVLRSDLEKAVSKVLTDKKYRNELSAITKKQNQIFRNGRNFWPEVAIENTLGASKVPGFVPKLPFVTEWWEVRRERY